MDRENETKLKNGIENTCKCKLNEVNSYAKRINFKIIGI